MSLMLDADPFLVQLMKTIKLCLQKLYMWSVLFSLQENLSLIALHYI